MPDYKHVYALLDKFVKLDPTKVAVDRIISALDLSIRYQGKRKFDYAAVFANMPKVDSSGYSLLQVDESNSLAVFERNLLIVLQTIDDMKKLPIEIRPKDLLAYEIEFKWIRIKIESFARHGVPQNQFAAALLPYLYKFVEEYYHNQYNHIYLKINMKNTERFKFNKGLYYGMFRIMKNSVPNWLKDENNQNLLVKDLRMYFNTDCSWLPVTSARSCWCFK